MRRLANELKECGEYLGEGFELDPDAELPIRIDVSMSGVFGYDAPGSVVTEHSFSVLITEEYGQRKPEVRWRSPIFHPNIMRPEDGGYVCVKLLEDWTYGSRLSAFLKCVENLVMEPNPDSPFGTESCLAAAEYFKGMRTRFRAEVVSGARGWRGCCRRRGAPRSSGRGRCRPRRSSCRRR